MEYWFWRYIKNQWTPQEPVLYISPSYHILLEDKQNQQCKQLRSYLDFWSTKKPTLAMRITLDFNLQKNTNFENDHAMIAQNAKDFSNC